MINADGTGFDYLKNVQGVIDRMQNLRTKFLRLLLSPECNGGSPAAVAYFQGSFGRCR